MKTFRLRNAIPVIAVLVISPVFAQDRPGPGSAGTSDEVSGARFWQATIGASHYMVLLDRISAVSRHQYVLDGALLVDEVTIDTLGQGLARFYFIRPVTVTTSGSGVSGVVNRAVGRAEELTAKATSRLGTNVHEMVQKNYPATSHARTVEFRILSEKNLDDLHRSIRTAWENGRGRRFAVKESE